MGIEALSRGAEHATFLETDPAAVAALRANLAAVREQANATVLAADALHPPRPAAPVAVAFLDPPYREGLGPAALAALADAGWFAPGAVVTLELAAREEFAAPPGFAIVDERRYGAARIVVLRAGATPRPERS
jgi:16S rRNA (guanine966-N2)-methyltransferase